MFDFLKSNTHKEMEKVVTRLELNMSNNYKDAAQEDILELEKLYHVLDENRGLNAKQKAYYSDKINHYKMKYQGYTHKDQKTRW